MTKPISLQLYTLREQSEQDFRAVVDRVAEIGYAGVEPAGLYGLKPAEFRSIVEDNGMRVSSAHIRDRLDDADTVNRVADEMAEMGAPFMVLPFLPPDKFTSPEGIEKMAGVLNGAVEAAESRGMTLGYHNHYFEFVTVDGKSAFDLFLDALDPRVVLEIDIYWAQTGGSDPAELVGAARLPCPAPAREGRTVHDRGRDGRRRRRHGRHPRRTQRERFGALAHRRARQVRHRHVGRGREKSTRISPVTACPRAGNERPRQRRHHRLRRHRQGLRREDQDVPAPRPRRVRGHRHRTRRGVRRRTRDRQGDVSSTRSWATTTCSPS